MKVDGSTHNKNLVIWQRMASNPQKVEGDMREFFFRGIHVNTVGGGKPIKEWYHGNLLIDESRTDEYRYRIQPKENGQLYAAPVISETIGQYTGLHDKNGKEIYEGDIVHCVSQTDTANMVVIWEEGEFHMVLCEEFKNYIPLCGFYCIRNFTKDVIGNIYDNPELLEVTP